jgi:hypothetical protein
LAASFGIVEGLVVTPALTSAGVVVTVHGQTVE